MEAEEKIHRLFAKLYIDEDGNYIETGVELDSCADFVDLVNQLFEEEFKEFKKEISEIPLQFDLKMHVIVDMERLRESGHFDEEGLEEPESERQVKKAVTGEIMANADNWMDFWLSIPECKILEENDE